MSTTRITLLAYEAEDGNPLVEAVHKSLSPTRGRMSQQAYADLAEWSLRFTGPYSWERDWGNLPSSLREVLHADNGMALEHCADLQDVTEALARVGTALEAYMADTKAAQAALTQRILAAQAYGKVQELPIEQVQS